MKESYNEKRKRILAPSQCKMIVLCVWISVIIVCYSIILFLLIHNTNCKCKIPCKIPSPENVMDYCKSKGFENGWVTQTCGANQVQCHSKIGDLDKFVCIEYISEVTKR